MILGGWGGAPAQILTGLAAPGEWKNAATTYAYACMVKIMF